MNVDTITRMILNTVLIYCFITIFYFTYVINTAKNSFTIQINTLVDNIYYDFKNMIAQSLEDKDEATIFGIKEAVDIVLKEYEPDFTSLDTEFTDNLNSIKNSFIYSCYGIIIYVLFVAALLYYFKNYNIFSMIADSLLSVFFILMFEFIFINIITTNYVSIDSAKIKRDLYKKIYDML